MKDKPQELILGKPISKVNLYESLKFFQDIFWDLSDLFVKHETSLEESLKKEAHNVLKDFIGCDFQVYSKFTENYRSIYWTREDKNYSQLVTIIPANKRYLVLNYDEIEEVDQNKLALCEKLELPLIISVN
jgi:hypothetical protein